VALGAVQPPSLLPVAIATSVVLVLLTLVVAFLRGRAATRDPDAPAAPTEPSVH
jgi:negative regulator of sigma E activity